VIRALYIAYLSWLNAMDERELNDRCIDGSACTAWCIRVRDQINRRQDRIDGLRAPRFNAWGIAR
jgi:hypothetical protein